MRERKISSDTSTTTKKMRKISFGEASSETEEHVLSNSLISASDVFTDQFNRPKLTKDKDDVKLKENIIQEQSLPPHNPAKCTPSHPRTRLSFDSVLASRSGSYLPPIRRLPVASENHHGKVKFGLRPGTPHPGTVTKNSSICYEENIIEQTRIVQCRSRTKAPRRAISVPMVRHPPLLPLVRHKLENLAEPHAV